MELVSLRLDEGVSNKLELRQAEQLVLTAAALIPDLSKKSELAYEKVQDIANRAVTAARRESYMPPVQHAGVAVRDDKQG